MIKVALVVTIVSMGNLGIAPDVSIPVYYDNHETCNKQLDSLKQDVNAIESSLDTLLKFINKNGTK